MSRQNDRKGNLVLQCDQSRTGVLVGSVRGSCGLLRDAKSDKVMDVFGVTFTLRFFTAVPACAFPHTHTSIRLINLRKGRKAAEALPSFPKINLHMKLFLDVGRAAAGGLPAQPSRIIYYVDLCLCWGGEAGGRSPPHHNH